MCGGCADVLLHVSATLFYNVFRPRYSSCGGILLIVRNVKVEHISVTRTMNGQPHTSDSDGQLG